MSTTYEPEPETAANATGNATTTVDVDAYLEQSLGRRYRNVVESVALVTVYCVIFLTGVAGNVCTCVVIVRNKRMHTATNYYLFSLAVSDLLTLVLGQSCHSYRDKSLAYTRNLQTPPSISPIWLNNNVYYHPHTPSDCQRLRFSF